MPREFTSQERALLLRISLGAGDPPELLTQIERAVYDEPWFEGSQSFSITVPSDAPRCYAGSDLGRGRRIVGEASVYRGGVETDDHYIGGLILWSQDGAISLFEYYWVTPEMPSELPALDEALV